MPLMYNEVYLPCRGALTTCDFPLVWDGRRVRFHVEGGSLRKQIYTFIDGVLNETPFHNGGRMETPVRGLSRLVSTPYEAYAIVVDQEEISLNEMDFTSKPFAVTYNHGEHGEVTLSCSIRSTMQVTDPLALVKAYLEQGIQSPEWTAECALWGEMKRQLISRTRDHFRDITPLEILNEMDDLSLDMEAQVVQAVENELPWLRVRYCDIAVQVVNHSEVVEKTNTLYTLSREIQERLLDVITKIYGERPMAPEVGQMMISYIQANPNADKATLLDICGGLKDLSQYNSPAQLLQTARQLGLMGGTI